MVVDVEGRVRVPVISNPNRAYSRVRGHFLTQDEAMGFEAL
jgi:hypothetical protein